MNPTPEAPREGHDCQCCGRDVSLRDDSENTGFCDPCAQGLVDDLLAALEAAKREIYLLAENATDRIRMLGGECDPFEQTAEITIKRAGIDAALAKAKPGNNAQG